MYKKMETEKFVKDLISDFNGSYKDFFSYVYKIFTKKIDSISRKEVRDKYIKIRKSILNYIIVNEKTITAELNRNRK